MTHKERTPEVTHKIMSAIKSKDTKPDYFYEKLYGRIRYVIV